MILNNIAISLMQAFKQALIYIPLMVGGYISISLMKLPDIALESAFSFGAVLTYCVLVLIGNILQPYALVITLGMSILGGIVVGFLVTSFSIKLRIPHLLSSILTVGIFQGLSLLMMGSISYSVYLFHYSFNNYIVAFFFNIIFLSSISNMNVSIFT
ncbi:hypothetical protein EBU24_04495, partial [bacterium]|nr:hypothetical protein [bacterium]